MVASAAAFAPASTTTPVSTSTQLSETTADLKTMAPKLNPLVGFWDPLQLCEAGFWGLSNEQTVGWLRHAEIKHGRVAMAAFVGYIVQSNFVFPWSLTFGGVPHPGTDLSPPEQWDALPTAAKVQVIAFVGFLEWYSELSDNDNGPHYTKGGKPGQYPSFDNIPHNVPFNLFDPFKISKNRTPEQKEKGLLTEINNGRLAMLGIFGFLCEQTIPGSVPLLAQIVKPYSGEVMAPFSAEFAAGAFPGAIEFSNAAPIAAAAVAPIAAQVAAAADPFL
ncbi:chlorophyll a/b-binding protein [Fragilariopsis cylindrus CCMP1102]|uniref:Chlorophyll a/b-binding protein n=1 Tax=Fragilariopsis cylindrus CCMP1102 TaxID=635003 RepID=A0A1E7EP91_9STRA|nr:chlorophyll a/b-binding protein [Fragilariopsis cylindrus CCMP1102]|eukprot:OEU07788.1 chlorophyll a/b-binding protein [Fragilariopsis cylindrus CCMP1102]